MRIESGPTLERKVRTTLLFLMFAGMGAYFAYDGWKGYEKVNFRGHLDQIPADKRSAAENATVYRMVTPEILPQVGAALEKEPRLAEQRAALVKLIGGPPSYEDDKIWYYFGPAFRIRIPLAAGAGTRVVGESTEFAASSILLQKIIAICLGVASIWIGIKLLGIYRTRCVVDEAGLACTPGDSVAWEQMKSLDSSRFREKGWVDLVFEKNGHEQKLRLDEYHLAQFDEIIDALCDHKGFANPLPSQKESLSADQSETKETHGGDRKE